MDRVAELLDGWRQLAAWRHDWTASPGPRRWNTLVDRLNRIAEEAVADPADVARLTAIADQDPDQFVRQDARQWIHPWVPRPPEREHLDRWLRHPLISLGDVAAEHGIALVPAPASPPAPGLALHLAPDREPDLAPHLPPEFAPDLAPEFTPHLAPEFAPRLAPDLAPGEESLSWVGTGEVLVQLETPEYSATTDAWAGLPQGGALQFRADGTVRHIEDPQPGADSRHPVDIWTFPEDCTQANERMLETIHSQWGAIEDYQPVTPLPILRGTGSRRVLQLPGRAPISYDLTPALTAGPRS
ncbi:hypothetical protein Q0Z83_013320 [Actinoplanes sichuanensis]|uniref:Uncharacterized protein n=1 Tax=Actinoplanes sichuanensis TaxID=512349 RepID=A0ABW4A4S7_9ACTN|nr:hypothetical protein [Actinoplanes sichuanensis]BEL03141.1 hypothetical protein Q0Z83_013320 [Actinoplanes sichuanensis]